MIEMFQNIINNYSNSGISTSMILAVLFMVLILSIYEFIIYRFVSHRSFYNKSLNITVAILPFFLSMIILCLQSNAIVTLGTIGALAIIRFRAAIKDPTDMLYLLWSVFIGIMCGCKLFEVGILTSLIVTGVLFVLNNIKFGKLPYVLIVHSIEDGEEELNKLFKSNKISYKFKSRNFTNKGYDYAIEFTSKELDSVKKELVSNNNFTKYSIIEYDADDIV